MKNTLFKNERSVIGRSNILGVGVSAINMKLAIEQINSWISRDERQYVCVANVHSVTESQRDIHLRRINNRAGMVTPDGMPLVWLSHLQGYGFVERVYGPDLLLAVCERSLETGWSHYFYGGGPGVAENLGERMRLRFPGIKIVGTRMPPFRKLEPDEDEQLVAHINTTGADLLWIGLGAPKQEYWMAEHLGRVQVPVMIGVGAAFDFHSGAKRQAPRLMQSMGLEWLYRLFSEPKRLWRRYLVNNPLFIGLALLQILGFKRYTLYEGE